jgi:hypothetical protein
MALSNPPQVAWSLVAETVSQDKENNVEERRLGIQRPDIVIENPELA